MHKYTRSKPNAIYSNFFKELIGYIHRRMCRWGRRQLPTQVSKILKKSGFFGQ